MTRGVLVIAMGWIGSACVAQLIGPPEPQTAEDRTPAKALIAPPTDAERGSPAAHNATTRETAEPDSASIEATPLGVPPESPAEEGALAPEGVSAWARAGQVLLPLAGVVAVIVGGGALWRRAGVPGAGLVGLRAPSPSGIAEILARYPIGRGQTVLVVRVHRRVLVLGQATSHGRLVTLCELTDADEVASLRAAVADADRRTAGMFGAALQQRGEPARRAAQPPVEDGAGISLPTGRAAPKRAQPAASVESREGLSEVRGGPGAVESLRIQLARLQHTSAGPKR